MSRTPDRFGDPGLVRPEILPTEETVRGMGPRENAVLAAAAGLVSGAYTLGAGLTSPRQAFVLAACSGAVLGLLVSATSRTATRYGIGLGPLARAALGSRGAIVLLWVAWAAMVSWGGAALSGLVRWLVPLVLATWHALGFAGGSPSALLRLGVGVGLLAGLAALSYRAARGGPVLLRVGAARSLSLVVAACAGVLVVGAIGSGGFPTPERETALPWTGAIAVLWSAVVAGLCVPLAGPEWGRLTKRDSQFSRGLGSVALWIAVVALTSGLLAAVAALVSRAALAVQGRATGGLVVDAALSAGLLGGWLAALAAVGMLAAVLPWLAVFAPAQALMAALPTRMAGGRAVGVTAVAVWLSGVAWSMPELAGIPSAIAGWFALPCVVLLVADDLVVRRGRVVLEELYLHSTVYGPKGGVRGGSLAALALGIAMLPPLGGGVVLRGLGAEPDGILGVLWGVTLVLGVALVHVLASLREVGAVHQVGVGKRADASAPAPRSAEAPIRVRTKAVEGPDSGVWGETTVGADAPAAWANDGSASESVSKIGGGWDEASNSVSETVAAPSLADEPALPKKPR